MQDRLIFDRRITKVSDDGLYLSAMKKSRLLHQFRKIAIAEGWSYILLLGLGMPLKYGMDWPEPNYVIGLAHGLLFVLYIIWGFWAGLKLRWSFATFFWVGLASLLPFGTFIADAQLFKPMAKKLEDCLPL
jgi:integral membrane protein